MRAARERTIVVTGAAQGIGAATATLLSTRGAHVIRSDIREAELRATVDAIRTWGGRATPVVGDVADEAHADAVAELAASTGTPVSALVNNAAVGVFGKTLESTSLEDWNRTLAVNLTSVFLMSRAVVPLIRRAGGGAIVNVASIHAYATSTGVIPYAASKGGVLALTRAMALDLAVDRIRAVCVVPGPIDTPMLRSHAQIEGRTLDEMGFSSDDREIGHVAEAGAAADAIAFLVSDGARNITGSSVQVDAGILARF